MAKKPLFFDSLWFNIAATIISVIVLIDSIRDVFTKGLSFGTAIFVIIWCAILFHFGQKLYFCLKKRNGSVQA